MFLTQKGTFFAQRSSTQLLPPWCSARSNLKIYIHEAYKKVPIWMRILILTQLQQIYQKKLPLLFLSFTSCFTCSWRRPNMRGSPQKISWQPRSTNWRFSFSAKNNWNGCSLWNRTDLRFYFFWQWPAWKYSIYAQKWKTSMLATAQNSFPLAIMRLPTK